MTDKPTAEILHECPSCETEEIHTPQGRCLGCWRYNGEAFYGADGSGTLGP